MAVGGLIRQNREQRIDGEHGAPIPKGNLHAYKATSKEAGKLVSVVNRAVRTQDFSATHLPTGFVEIPSASRESADRNRYTAYFNPMTKQGVIGRGPIGQEPTSFTEPNSIGW